MIKVNSCIFCNMEAERVVIRDLHGYAVYDIFPVSKGHILIIPKRHFIHIFQASEEEILSIFRILNRAKVILDKEYSPDGYNIGINCGKFAGQTVMHAHVHIIPRYKGDVDDPRGGIRRMMHNLVPYPENNFKYETNEKNN